MHYSFKRNFSVEKYLFIGSGLISLNIEMGEPHSWIKKIISILRYNLDCNKIRLSSLATNQIPSLAYNFWVFFKAK